MILVDTNVTNVDVGSSLRGNKQTDWFTPNGVHGKIVIARACNARSNLVVSSAQVLSVIASEA